MTQDQNPAPPRDRISRRALGTVAGATALAAVASTVLAASPADAATVVTHVNTIADLKTQPITSPSEPIFVLGYAAAGDGGGGVFYWDTSAAGLADGGLVIASSVSTAGAWRRFTDQEDWLSPEWFGCACNGTTDDSAAFQAALRSAVANGRAVRLPGAVIKLAAAVTLPTGAGSRRVAIVGNGPQVSQLKLTNSGKLDLNLGDATEYSSGQLLLKDFAIRADSTLAAGTTALKATFNRTSGTTPQGAVVENVEIAGLSDSSGPAVGIQLVDAQGLRLTGMRIAGRKNTPRVSGSIGILIQGSSIPVDMFINEAKIYFMETAVKIDGNTPHHIEGVTLDRCAFVACNYGVVATAPTSEPGLWLSVNNSTMNCSQGCVIVQNWANIKISGNLFYGDVGSPSTFDAINIYSGFTASLGSLSVITDNIIQFTGSVAYTTRGISIGGGPAEDSMVISNNVIAFFSYGILLNNDAERVAIAETNVFRSNTTNVYNAGTNNVVKPALESWT